jgi:hypothetical protein
MTIFHSSSLWTGRPSAAFAYKPSRLRTTAACPSREPEITAARLSLNPKLSASSKEMEALDLNELGSRLRSQWGELNAGELKQLSKYCKTLAERLDGELERRAWLH